MTRTLLRLYDKINFGPIFGLILIEWSRFWLYLPNQLLNVVIIFLRVALPYSVFQALANSNQITQIQVNELVWAVLIGQILYKSNSRVESLIKKDIRSGDIVTRLSEPINYLLAKTVSGLGFFFPSLAFLSLVFGPITYYLFPLQANWLWLGVMVIVSAVLYQTYNLLLGLTAFLIEENDSIFWISSKLFLIFGNQIIPISLMPLAVIQIAQFTPFYLILAGPIEVASGRADGLLVLGLSLFYILIFWLLAKFLLHKLKSRIVING